MGAGDTVRGGDREEGDGAWVIPGDFSGCGGAVEGKKRRGSGRHIGWPVWASVGPSQYVVFGYGNLIVLNEARAIRAASQHNHTS